MLVHDTMPGLRNKIAIFSEAFNKWSNMNGLVIAEDKIQLIMHNRAVSVESFVICGTKVTPQKSITVLGIEIDANKNWGSHIANLNLQLRSALFLYKEISKVVNAKSVRTFIIATLVSKIKFGMTAWGSVFNPPKYHHEAPRIKNTILMKKLECTLNHIARIGINYRGYYQNLGIKELYH